MANKELLIITSAKENLLPRLTREIIHIKKPSFKIKQVEERYSESINSPEEIKKRKIHALKSIKELLDKDFNSYKKLSLADIKKKIVDMEGVSVLERQPQKTAEDFILKAWEEDIGSRKINSYLFFLSKVYPEDLNNLLIITEKNKNKLVLLRDKASSKKNYR